jgi:hypothetical protein
MRSTAGIGRSWYPGGCSPARDGSSGMNGRGDAHWPPARTPARRRGQRNLSTTTRRRGRRLAIRIDGAHRPHVATRSPSRSATAAVGLVSARAHPCRARDGTGRCGSFCLKTPSCWRSATLSSATSKPGAARASRKSITRNGQRRTGIRDPLRWRRWSRARRRTAEARVRSLTRAE